MALVLKDRVKETTTSTGTGSVVLAGAVTGFQSFASALADGDTTYYTIEDGTDWETGLGTWAESTSTLARTTIFESSNSSSAVDFGAGSKNVFITLPATRTATTKVYATIDDLPMTGNQAGDQAFVSATNRLYLFSGAGWYNIALINQTPTVTGNSASYVLSTDGTSTVITLSATDPEGLPIVWSHVAAGLDSEATITNEDNVFTITPSTNTANEGEFSVTFRASDGVNIGTASSDFTLIFATPYWIDTILSIDTSSTNGIANSTFIDRSTNSLTVTPTGTPLQTAFHPYLDNWSVEFDGTSDSLTIPASSSFAFDTGDFTIEFWGYFNSIDQSDTIYIHGNDTNTVQLFFVGGKLRLNNNSVALVLDTITTIPTGQWVHLAVVRSSGTVTWYLNGTADGTIANSTNWSDFGTDLTIGRDPINGRDLDGYISNLRVVKGTAVYTANFTPPTENLTAVSGTSLLTCQSNRFIDNSTNAHAITVGGNPVVSAFNPFGQESEYAVGENKGSSYFNGSDSENIYTTNSAVVIPSTTWSVECWIYPTILANYKGVFGRFIFPEHSPMLRIGASGQIEFGFTSGIVLTSSGGVVKLNMWHHLAVVNNNGALNIFVNGLSVGTASFAVTESLTRPFTIGSTYISSEYFDGYIADFKATATALYTTNFTPPTAPVGNTSASLYLPMDNAGIFDKTGNHTLTLTGNTLTSTTQTKYADTAMYFDGSGDYLTAGDIDLHTNDFTIETWFYQTATGQYSSIFSTTINTGTANTLRISTGPSNNTMQVAGQGVALLNASTSFSNNVWNHVALTRSGSTLRLFLNGSQVGTVSNSTNFVSDNFIIGDVQGQGAPYYFTGYMENFQILKGVAKYTANFTPPASEQGKIYQAES
jgi:hypothetical protein